MRSRGVPLCARLQRGPVPGRSAVRPDSLPAAVEQTHLSLFDGSLEGLCLRDRPVFSVQYHPEASPGPHDSAYLFERFLRLIEASK